MTTKPASRPSDLLACRYCGSGRVVVKGIRDGQQAGCNTCFAKGPPIFYGPEGVDAARDAAMRAWNNGARELDAEREQTPPSDTALADTQRAIIEAAEARGYERGLKEATLQSPAADEAVAWMLRDAEGGGLYWDDVCVWGDASSANDAIESMRDDGDETEWEAMPLYLRPQPATPQPQNDDPEMDGTDMAHPAWWRGHEQSVQVLCQKVNDALDGKDEGAGVSSEPWESTRRRLIATATTQPPSVSDEDVRSAISAYQADSHSPLFGDSPRRMRAALESLAKRIGGGNA